MRLGTSLNSPRCLRSSETHGVGSLAKIGLTLAASALLLTAQSGASSAATMLNIDFGNYYGAPTSDYGAYANQAGVWNEISSTGTTSLVGLNGDALSGVSLSLNLNSSIESGVNGNIGPNSGLSANDQALVGDNFFTVLGSWSVTLSGLQNGAYNLYIYADVNNTVPTSAYTVNGVTGLNLNGSTNDNSPLEQGINYAIDSVLISDGTLTIDSGSLPSGFLASGLAGLQLTPDDLTTPLPPALPLFATGLGCLGFLGRRRKKAQAAV